MVGGGGGGGGVEGSEVSVKVSGEGREGESPREARVVVCEQVSIGRLRGLSSVPGPQKARRHEGGRIEGLAKRVFDISIKTEDREADDDMRFRMRNVHLPQAHPGGDASHIDQAARTQG